MDDVYSIVRACKPNMLQLHIVDLIFLISLICDCIIFLIFFNFIVGYLISAELESGAGSDCLCMNKELIPNRPQKAREF